MANHKSAKKRAVQSIKKRNRNKSYMSDVKTHIKKYLASLKVEGENAETGTLFTKVQSLLHKSCQKGLMHRNKASRTISRLAKAAVK